MSKKYGDFIIKKSVTKYKNRWIKVVEDQVIRPDGKAGIFGVVNIKGGSSILPIDDKGFVYLAEEFHYAFGKKSISAAHGGREDGGSYLAGAKRELKEELGITAKKWIDLGFVSPFSTTVRTSQKMYLAKDLEFGPSNNTDGENIKIVKVKFDKAFDMVMKGKILHAPSCVLILKAYYYMKK